MDKYTKMKDFVASIVLILLSAYIITDGVRMYNDAGKVLYTSPALIPLLLGSLLLVLSVVLLVSSSKDGGFKARGAEMKELWKAIVSDSNTVRMLIGFAMMAVYTFLLLGNLPFWAATVIFLIALMIYLECGNELKAYLNWKAWAKVIVISVVTVALIILLFQVAFRVPLP